MIEFHFKAGGNVIHWFSSCAEVKMPKAQNKRRLRNVLFIVFNIYSFLAKRIFMFLVRTNYDETVGRESAY